MDGSNPTAAASQTRRTRMWRASSAGPNALNLGGAKVVLSRARDQARNNPWAATALDRLTSNGIATGIQCKGLWGDDAYRAAEAQLYARFMNECDADGVCDGFGLQALAWREWKEAGELFVRFRARRPGDGFAVPLQVQLIEAEQCPSELYTMTSTGNEVRAGIEFDRIGRRVAYWMYREHPGDRSLAYNSMELVRVPADQVLHVYQPKRAGQLRGTPDITPALMKMFTLDRFSDAVLERQAIANLFLGFYTTKADVESEDPASGAPPVGQPEASGEEGIQLAGMEPATMQELPPGMDVKFSQPPDAGTNFSEYMRIGLMEIAATVGVPYEVMTGDLRNVSDRALRLILNEFRRLIEMWQWLTFIPRYCQPIRAKYLDTAVLARALQIDGYAEKRAAVLETLWVPEGWPYSHPVQDVDADIKAIRAGLDSRTSTVLRRGQDPERIEREAAADNERGDQLGLVFDSDARKTSAAGLTQARAPGTELPDTDPKEE